MRPPRRQVQCLDCPGSPVVCEWGSGRVGEGGWCRQHWTRSAFTRDLMTGHLDDYRCSAEVRGSFQETAPRKTAKNTVKHRDGGVGSVLANHRGGGEISVVITTLQSWFSFTNAWLDHIWSTVCQYGVHITVKTRLCLRVYNTNSQGYFLN